MKSSKLGYWYLLITIVLFSTYEVVGKTLVGKVNPFQVNFLRFFIGGCVLFCFVLARKDIKITFKDAMSVLVLGIINVAFSMNLLQLSLSIPNSKASMAAVIFSSNPIFVTVFSAAINKEKVGLYKIIGLLFGMAGVSLISINAMKSGMNDMKSPVLALLSAMLYGLYTVLAGRLSARIGSLKMNAYSFLSGSLVLLPFFVLFKIPIISFDYSALLPILYLSLFVTGIAYFTYFMGISLTSASKGSLVFFLKPVLATIFSLIILDEVITANFVLGTALIIFGITIALYLGYKKTVKN